MSLNSGPPRLRIDNVINLRAGTSIDDEFEARKRVPPPQPLPQPDATDDPTVHDSEGREPDGKVQPEESRGSSPEEGIVARDMEIQEHDRDDLTYYDDKRKNSMNM